MSRHDSTPQSVTNRPRDDRRLAQLLGVSGAVRHEPREEPSRLGLLAIGVLIGILLCLAFGVWQSATRAASPAQPWPTTGGEYHGQAALKEVEHKMSVIGVRKARWEPADGGRLVRMVTVGGAVYRQFKRPDGGYLIESALDPAINSGWQRREYQTIRWAMDRHEASSR